MSEDLPAEVSYKAQYPWLIPELIIHDIPDDISICSDGTTATTGTIGTVFSMALAEKCSSFEQLYCEDSDDRDEETCSVVKKLRAELRRQKTRRSADSDSDEDVSQISQIFDEMSTSIDLSISDRRGLDQGLRRVQSMKEASNVEKTQSTRNSQTIGATSPNSFTPKPTNIPRNIPIRRVGPSEQRVLYLPPEVQIKRPELLTAFMQRDVPERRSSVSVLTPPRNEETRRASVSTDVPTMTTNLNDIKIALRALAPSTSTKIEQRSQPVSYFIEKTIEVQNIVHSVKPRMSVSLHIPPATKPKPSFERATSESKSSTSSNERQKSIKDKIKAFEREHSEERSVSLCIAKEVPKPLRQRFEELKASVDSKLSPKDPKKDTSISIRALVKSKIANFENSPAIMNATLATTDVKQVIPKIKSRIESFEATPTKETSVSRKIPIKIEKDAAGYSSESENIQVGQSVRSRIEGYERRNSVDASESCPANGRRRSRDSSRDSKIRAKIVYSFETEDDPPNTPKSVDIDSKFQEILQNMSISEKIKQRLHESPPHRSNSLEAAADISAPQSAEMSKSLYIPSTKVCKDISTAELDNVIHEIKKEHGTLSKKSSFIKKAEAAQAILKSSSVKEKIAYKSFGFVSGMSSKKNPKKIGLESVFCEAHVTNRISIRRTPQYEEFLILMSVRASLFDKFPGLPGVFLTLNVPRKRRLNASLNCTESPQTSKDEDVDLQLYTPVMNEQKLEKAKSFEVEDVDRFYLADSGDESDDDEDTSWRTAVDYSTKEEKQEEDEHENETQAGHEVEREAIDRRALKRQNAIDQMCEIETEVYLSPRGSPHTLMYCPVCEVFHHALLDPHHNLILWKRQENRHEEPRTETIHVKKKRDVECFALTNIEAPVFAKEAANKTIIAGITEKSLVTEKVSLTVKAPKPNDPPSPDSDSACCVSETTSQLVEDQLREISKQAEQLAKSIKNQAASVEEENLDVDVMSTSASSSFVRLDKIGDNDKYTPSLFSLAKTTSSPRLNGFEVKPIVKKVMPTIGIEKQKMVDRLSRGIADLTAGSQDRLQKWKNKLNSGSRREKDSSEPPPTNRNIMFSGNSQSTDSSNEWTAKGSSQTVNKPRPLHSSKSLQNANSMGNVPSMTAQLSLDMEHRTLKSRENRDGGEARMGKEFYSTAPHSMSMISSKLTDSMSQPTRLMPMSGIRPDGDLIKPIAFRPVGSQHTDFNRRQSASAFRSDIRDRPVNSLTSVPAVPTAAVPTGPNIVRPKGMYQPSTSFCHVSAPVQPVTVENEYDTVPEFLEKEKLSDVGSNGSDYSGYHGSIGYLKHSNGSSSQHSSLGSPPNTVQKQKSFNSSASSSASRNSSGVHVTPSPSDSGIVDYESIIRDKENELREVRTTMEQNEEIIVKVYQEKERNYKNEISELRQRLAASEKGENALRSQLASCQRQTESMRVTIEGIRSEKNDLMRRCAQLERDLNVLRNERVQTERRPIPAPRQVKEPSPANDDLRDEVSQLRKEVSTLREALASVALLNEDRRYASHHSSSSNVMRSPSESKVRSLERDRLI